MPTRDDQEYEQRRQQIIDGALEVFSAKGFEKATNKDIAEASGVGSPGLIYHYFKDKADLFRQVLEHRIPALQLFSHSDELMEMPPREVLTTFARAFTQISNNRAATSTLKLLLGESLRRPELAAMMNSIGPHRGFTFLTRYLERQMELGVLRKTDVGAAVRCFVGPLVIYIITREIFPQADTATLEPETMVAATVDMFLRGLEPSRNL
jgi:AcrR family transcriptional regulator